MCTLLGDLPEIRKYDFLKSSYKNKNDSFTRTLLLDHRAVFETKVSKKVSELQIELQVWERDFMKKNNCHAPSPDDYQSDEYILNLSKMFNTGKQLLRQLRIK